MDQLSPISNKALWKQSCIRLKTARVKTASMSDDAYKSRYMKMSAFVREDPIPDINIQNVKSSNTFFKKEIDKKRLKLDR